MGKKKEKGKAEPKEIDQADFIRTAEALPPLKGVSNLAERAQGEFFNASDIFEPWNEDEKYQEVDDVSSFVPHYSNDIKSVENQSVKSSSEYLSITAVNGTESKGKKNAKTAPELSDRVLDDDGNKLPRVFTGAAYDGERDLKFRCQWTAQQIAVKAQLEAEQQVQQSLNSDEKDEQKDDVDNDNLNSKDEEKVPSPTIDVLDPKGQEYDSLVCAAFRIVARFSTPQNSDGDAHADAFPFLWKSIYPQLPDGTPCFNPSGKYCVKMFVGGRWVKVKVFDAFPVNDSNEPVIASSIDPYELWPSILSKALYTVSSGCGYHHTLFCKNASLSALHAASFVEFAVHTLTGWLPSAPINMSQIYCGENSERACSLLDVVNFGGASIISSEKIPHQEPIVPGDIKKGCGTPRKVTKKQLRDEMKKKVVERDNLIKKIKRREKFIEEIESSVSNKFSEVHCLVVVPKSEKESEESDNSKVPVVHPVLALSYPDEKRDPGAVSVLVDWKVSKLGLEKTATENASVENSSAQEEVGENSGNANRTSAVDGEEATYPHSSTVRYRWVSLKDLCKENIVFMFGADTKLHVPNSADFDWHWQVKEEADEKTKKEKKEKGKSSESLRSPLGVASFGVEGGVFPPLFLKLTPADLGPPASDGDTNDVEVEKEKEENGSSSSGILSLSLSLQADIAKRDVGASEGEMEDMEKTSFDCVDDAVLVLEEVGRGGDPLVLRLQLCQSNPFPFARTSFRLPLDSGRLDKEVLFLVRVFTSASVAVRFCSSGALMVQDAEEMWRGEMNGLSLVQNGSSFANYAKTEQVLFRYPLQLAKPVSGEDEQQDSSGSGSESDEVFLFFHTPDKEIMKTISLVVCDGDSGHCHVSPRVGHNAFQLQRGKAPLTIVGRSFHAVKNIPEFNWKLYALSKLPLQSPEQVLGSPIVPFASEPDVVRYKGSYMPNNNLTILRDVLSVEASSFPLSFRFSAFGDFSSSDPAGDEGDSDMGKDSHLAFNIKLYSLPSRQLVKELNGRNMLQYYMLPKAIFVESPNEDGKEDDKSPTKKKDVKKDKKKGKNEVPGDAIEILMEVVIDESRMAVPTSWKSRYPYRFYQSDGSMPPSSSISDREKEDVKAVFSWQLDFNAGQVPQVRHDTHDLEKFAASKNRWEEESAGRSERAQAASEYLKALRLAQGKFDEVSEASPSVGLLSDALEKSSSEVVARESLLQHIAQPKEHIVSKAEGTSAVVEDEVLSAEKNVFAEDSLECERLAKASVDDLDAFNQKMRDISLERISVIRCQVKENFKVSIQNWESRDAYKSFVEKRNDSLKFLLEKSVEAKEKAFAAEDEADNKKSAKGKATKGKKK